MKYTIGTEVKLIEMRQHTVAANLTRMVWFETTAKIMARVNTLVFDVDIRQSVKRNMFRT